MHQYTKFQQKHALHEFVLDLKYTALFLNSGDSKGTRAETSGVFHPVKTGGGSVWNTWDNIPSWLTVCFMV